MAAILVALPVYLLVMRLILREAQANPDRLESGVRKWLTYLALLLAATGVVSDLVWFVDYFLMGGLTLRFALKCFTVLAICGSIFWYYLGFLRGQARSGRFAFFALAGASLAFCLGLGVAGTPAVQRHLEADNRRVQDLRAIATTLSGMTTLPQSLQDVSVNRPSLRVTDPETRSLYQYAAKSLKEYELCATFATADDVFGRGNNSEFWSHPKGRACFNFDITRQVPW
jgi:hypothetical protein